MKSLFSYILPFLACCLIACDDSDLTVDTPQSVVVEGWIENGEFPIVIITKTLPVTTEYQDMSDLSDYLVRWAKVTVSDGERSVVLTGLYDESYYQTISTRSRHTSMTILTRRTTICSSPRQVWSPTIIWRLIWEPSMME